MKSIITQLEASFLLGISYKHVWMLVQIGRLQSTKNGSVYIFDKDEVLRFKESRATTGLAPVIK